MKYLDMISQNQILLKTLELAGKDRKKHARHETQFKTDPKFNRGKQTGVNIWEFDVSPFSWNSGAFRLLRRQEGSDVTWWWASHVAGNNFTFELITDIPSFKPVKQTPTENAIAAETWKPLVDPVLEAVDISNIKAHNPENPFGLSEDDLDFLSSL